MFDYQAKPLTIEISGETGRDKQMSKAIQSAIDHIGDSNPHLQLNKVEVANNGPNIRRHFAIFRPLKEEGEG
jgi:hypothetical protein